MEDLDEKIKKAYEELNNMNLNEEERDLAETRYKNLVNIKDTQDAIHKRGLQEGIQQRNRARKRGAVKRVVQLRNKLESQRNY